MNPEITNHVKQTYLGRLNLLFQKTLAYLICAGSLMLSGCWQVVVIKNSPITSAQSSNNSSTKKVGSELLKAHYSAKKNHIDSESLNDINKKMNMSVKTIAANTSALGEPVIYDTHLWMTLPVTKLDILTAGSQPQELAKVISIDENSLDYASHPAVKHRFMKNNAPYFDLVDSKEYLEISWHFANPNDSENVKKASIDHAKKSHRFARQLMGNDGGQLVADILEGKKFKNIAVNGVFISLAKCEFYGCVVVMKKPQPAHTTDLVGEAKKENDTTPNIQ